MGYMNDLADRIYAFNVSMGWHSGPPDLGKFLMNLHSEVSELWEAWRVGKVTGQRMCAPAVVHGQEMPSCERHCLPLNERGLCSIGEGILEKGSCDKAAKMAEMGHRPLTCMEEELADILIRTLDTARTFGVDIDNAVAIKMAYNATRAHRHGGKLA